MSSQLDFSPLVAPRLLKERHLFPCFVTEALPAFLLVLLRQSACLLVWLLCTGHLLGSAAVLSSIFFFDPKDGVILLELYPVLSLPFLLSSLPLYSFLVLPASCSFSGSSDGISYTSSLYFSCKCWNLCFFVGICIYLPPFILSASLYSSLSLNKETTTTKTLCVCLFSVSFYSSGLMLFYRLLVFY